MNRAELLYGFDLYDQLTPDQQIYTETQLEFLAAVVHAQPNLPFDLNSSRPQLMVEAALVDGLQEPWAKGGMH